MQGGPVNAGKLEGVEEALRVHARGCACLEYEGPEVSRCSAAAGTGLAGWLGLLDAAAGSVDSRLLVHWG